ncbi:macro domain-containing protein [Pseudobacteroides cellulosolvens]|uniref:Appr-1-p processing domain protein n=1 Tax=Pseudobacteroides cellulosolvens ATCC 35603 = DSM 2933 TaxID=398512 RepID=A0A0L6JKL9_9FIRM|nr:macro domain-containing protein [Pseudobacteroides cellulosolvens]KNY26391.1 Appr-1-p processing domain protein [Pseudobacteroides cellulosolvens ATCC 35603 = DSM 2933]
MKICFVDINSLVVNELKKLFENEKIFEFYEGNILSIARGAIVSPANSYGYMDGGIDEDYTDFFGISLQNAVMNRLDRIGGFLPVGSAFTIETDNQRIKYLIFAPTMELPGAVPAHNCYFAMKAILREIDKNNGRYEEVYCPGLCTCTGRVEPNIAAEEMYKAYKDWLDEKSML